MQDTRDLATGKYSKTAGGYGCVLQAPLRPCSAVARPTQHGKQSNVPLRTAILMGHLWNPCRRRTGRDDFLGPGVCMARMACRCRPGMRVDASREGRGRESSVISTRPVRLWPSLVSVQRVRCTAREIAALGDAISSARNLTPATMARRVATNNAIVSAKRPR